MPHYLLHPQNEAPAVRTLKPTTRSWSCPLPLSQGVVPARPRPGKALPHL